MDYFKKIYNSRRALLWLRKKTEENYRKAKNSISAIVKAIYQDKNRKHKEYLSERKDLLKNPFKENEETGEKTPLDSKELKKELFTLDKTASSEERIMSTTANQLRRDILDPEKSLSDLNALASNPEIPSPQVRNEIATAMVAEGENQEIDSVAKTVARQEKINLEKARTVSAELDTIVQIRAREVEKKQNPESRVSPENKNNSLLTPSPVTTKTSE